MTLLEKNIAINRISDKNSPYATHIPGLFSQEIQNSSPVQRYTKRFLKYIPPLESLTIMQKQCLEDFARSLSYIDEKLSVLRQNNIDYQLCLAGGAVRDFLLGRIEDINDHDIIVHFENNNTDIVDKCTQLLGDAVIGCFKDEETVYANQAMLGNIKLSGVTKPIDLIISKIPPLLFMTTFDFSICKVMVQYTTSSTYQDIYNNLVVTHTFLKDLEDNTISIHLHDFSKEHIEYFMGKHYKKLSQKYPGKTLKLLDKVDSTAKIYFNHLCLDMSLSDDNIDKPKVKI